MPSHRQQLAIVCLQSANRSRLQAQAATTDESRDFWNKSAARYLQLFWTIALGTYEGKEVN